MEGFKNELAQLLKKHNVYIIAKSNKDKDDMSLEIGFQKHTTNSWTGRHHLGGMDLEHTYVEKTTPPTVEYIGKRK